MIVLKSSQATRLTRYRAFVASIALLAGCQGQPLEEHYQSTSHALTEVQDRVLGFESPLNDWSSSVGTLGAGASASQGAASLAVTPNGWTEVNSIPLDTLDNVDDMLRYDLLMPEVPAWGETRAVLVSPSLELWWTELGRVELSQLEAGQYSTVSFPIPADVVAALGTSYSDLTVKLVLNAPALGDPYLLDNLRMTQDSAPPVPETDEETITVSLPKGIPVSRTFLVSSNHLSLFSQVRAGTDGVTPAIANWGPFTTYLQAEAEAYADIFSVGPVQLDLHTLVAGDVSSSGTIGKQPGADDDIAEVEGDEFPNTAVEAELISWTVSWPNEVGEDVFLDAAPTSDPVLTQLEPGAYGDFDVRSRNHVFLKTGAYFFESFNTEPEAELHLNTADGPIVVYVKGASAGLGLGSKAPVFTDAGEAGQLLLVFLGAGDVFVQGSWQGTIVAPSAFIKLERPSNPGLPEPAPSHLGAFFGFGVEIASGDHEVLHVPYRGQFPPPVSLDVFPTPAAPLPDSVTPLPGADLGSANCEPGLTLSGFSTNSNGDPFWEELVLPSPPDAGECQVDLLWCDADNNLLDPQFTLAELNEPALESDACGALQSRPGASCPLQAVGGICETSADCGTGEVCAEVCASPACLQVEMRCGVRYESCEGAPSEESFCAPTEFVECADSGAFGLLSSAEVRVGIDPVEEVPDSAQVPADEQIQVEPYQTLDIGFCDAPKAPSQEVSAANVCGGQFGSDKWGFFYECVFDANSELGLNELFGEGEFDVSVSAGYAAGAIVYGAKLEAMRVSASVGLAPCGVSLGGEVKIFGDAIAMLDLNQDGLEGETDALEPLADGDIETPPDLYEECNSAFAERNQKAGDARKALLAARTLKEFWKEKGTTIDICERTNFELGTDYDCLDPELLQDPSILDQWDEEYRVKSQELFDVSGSLKSSKDAVAAAASLNLLDIGHRYSVAAAEFTFPVGPVKLVLAIEAFGEWRVAGAVQAGLKYSGQLPQLSDALAPPFIPGTSFDGDLRAYAGPSIVPGASIFVVAFAGVGIPGVSVGIEGKMLVLGVTLPVDARISLSRIASDDPRSLEGTAFEGELLEGAPPRKVHSWEWGTHFGSRVDMAALSGELSLAARVRLLFFKKTFRKKLASWVGFTDSFPIVGIPAGEPIVGASPFGTYGDPVAFTQTALLEPGIEPTDPDPNAEWEGVLGDEPCIERPPTPR